jgi:predicted ATPase
VLLAGEPGIGKTRLIAELAREAARREVRVVSGRCWEEGGAPPYWPWTQVAPESERLRLFDAVGRFLAGAAARRPLLVTLDDVHAADEPSLLLLRFLADALAEERVLLVASYREGERRVRESSDLFGELARVGTRMPLRGLSSADIEAYVESVTGAEPAAQVVARLHELTGGNPFFVGEVVQLLAGEGADALDEAVKDPFRRLPEEVRALIRRRVAGLSREAVAVLRMGAVIGREFDLHLLQRTSRLTPARLLVVLREATAAGAIVELPATPRRYAFAHELVRETLYDDLPPRRRLELHRHVGQLLEDVHRDDLDPHLSEIARHLYLAAPLGDADNALEYLVRAGDRAAGVFAYEEAAAHYRHALELLPAAGDATGRRRSELLLRLGEAQWRSGDGAEAGRHTRRRSRPVAATATAS